MEMKEKGSKKKKNFAGQVERMRDRQIYSDSQNKTEKDKEILAIMEMKEKGTMKKKSLMDRQKKRDI